MNLEDYIKKQTVKVNQGSGVIVQPNSTDFSYVYTARHNIQNNALDYNAGLMESSEIIVKKIDQDANSGFLLVQVHEIYASDEHDVAILKVPFQEGVFVFPSQEPHRFDDSMRLWGYPYYAENRTLDLSEQLQVLQLVVHRTEADYLEFRNESVATYENVQGFSGGGVFIVSESNVTLQAIENRMSNQGADHNHISALPIRLFSELIAEKGIEKVFPKHMIDYSIIMPETFTFTNCVNEANLNRSKVKLQSLAQSYINAGICSPLEIIEELRRNLAVSQRKKSELESERLWISLLEVIVIKHLVDDKSQEEPLSISVFQELFESIRFIFIESTDSWKRHLRDILFTDLSGVKKDGVALLVLIGNEDLPSTPFIDSQIFLAAEPDISNGLDVSSNFIDIAESSPILTGDVKVIHFAKLHATCLIDHEFSLRTLNSNEIKSFLRNTYSEFIPSMEQASD